jgi:hypothetical protein
MMTSKADATEAFVWMWLPEATEPVVAGRLDQDGERLLFTYGASYRRRKSAIPIYEPELPLQGGVIGRDVALPIGEERGNPDRPATQISCARSPRFRFLFEKMFETLELVEDD